MGSYNRVTIVGNLGQDPELKFIPSGDAVANFSVACNESWKDKNGQKQERTEWVRVVAWRKLAELCGEYLAKGRQVLVDGKLQTRKWEDKDGNTRYTTEVVARDVVFLGSRGDGAPAQERGQPPHVDAAGDSSVPF